MFELLHEQSEGEIGHLPSPQAGHPSQLQVLHAERVVPPAKFVGEFPLPVVTAVLDVLMDTVESLPSRLAVSRALLAL